MTCIVQFAEFHFFFISERFFFLLFSVIAIMIGRHGPNKNEY